MSALVKLGLGHLQSEPTAVSANAQEWLGRFKTADEWLKTVFEGIHRLPEEFKEAGHLGKVLENAAPWIGVGAKAFPPAHMLFEIVSALTRVHDPRDLAILACTIAYQSVTDSAIREVGLPQRTSVTKLLRDSIGITREEFAYFTIEGALNHPFIRNADEVLDFYASRAGYEGRQIERLIGTVHGRFREELRLLISDGENQEKFEPLRNWLGTDAKDALVHEAIRRHVKYTRWLFEDAPLLDEEPFALKHIYIDTGCGVLTRAQLQNRYKHTGPVCDPFRRDDQNGGVHSLLETVLGYIRDPDFNDAIIVQGPAGSGKSSFAKQLAATLAIDGLMPLLVRLRDVANIGQAIFRTIGDALRYQDEVYLRGAQENFQPPPDLLGNGSLFNESIRYYDKLICPYVLIMDGWDEISLDVADGYKQKVQALLFEIRHEFFRERHARVRVILTGRPSDAIDTADSFFNDSTPVLTLRQMTPEQLVEFADKVRACVSDRPLQRYSSAWTMPSNPQLTPLFAKYEEGFRTESGPSSEQVLGVPFLAQLAFRVIADPGPDGYRVAEDSTTLLRRITEITVSQARLSAEDIRVDGNANPSDKLTGKKLYGDPLRRLLQKTAAKMTIAGRESISHKELSDYLHASNDEELIKQAEAPGGITGLLIAFFFKGGNTHLGCEFTHKALREYLFAEVVVESIKQLAKYADAGPALTVRTHYWRDFGDDDPRQEWSRNLTELLAPQWLTSPVRSHILNLLEWEIGRATSMNAGDETTRALTPSDWIYVRNGMADVYHWWAEGVPMRPQFATVRGTNQTEWLSPYFHQLVERQFERPPKPHILSVVPPRLITYDGHLGAALMQLTAAVHAGVREMVLANTNIKDVPRQGSPVQSQEGSTPVRFVPSGGHSEYFSWYCDRVNAAGWYRATFSWSEDFRFPSGAFLRGVSLTGERIKAIHLIDADLMGVLFEKAILEDADLSMANMKDANLQKAHLSNADLSGADLHRADLREADLQHADLKGADLRDADLSGAQLQEADLQRATLQGARLIGTYLTKANLRGTDLRHTNLQKADIKSANLNAADLSYADLHGADLRYADLEGANLRDANVKDADFRQARHLAPVLSAEQLRSLKYKPEDPL